MLKVVEMDTVVVQKEGLATADMDGEKVMMHMEKGRYYALNNIGSRIWEMVGKPQPIRNIIIMLLQQYDIDEDTCRIRVLAFINKLYVEGLVDVN